MAETSDLSHFLIDLEDEECPQFCLHLSAYQGEAEKLEEMLDDPSLRVLVNTRIRPFLATPLRLAATAGCLKTLKILLSHGAEIDLVDVKAQTPLFVALVNQHWECARWLLESGADPNGDEKNMCTPMSVMAQRGYYEGVKLLCQYGADTEDVYRLMTGMPGLPLAIAATYHHFKCFATLLLYGAKPGLSDVEHLNLPGYVTTQCSVPHAIIKYRCPPEFVYLFREFGGDLLTRDSRQRLATEITEHAPALELMKHLQASPLSLQSSCRLALRAALGREHLGKMNRLCAEHEKLRSNKILFNFLTCRSLYDWSDREVSRIMPEVEDLERRMRAEISCENLPPFIRVKRTHFKCSDDSSSGLQRNSSNKNSLNSSSCSIASSASSGVSLTDVVERLAQTRIQSGTTMDDSKTKRSFLSAPPLRNKSKLNCQKTKNGDKNDGMPQEQFKM